MLARLTVARLSGAHDGCEQTNRMTDVSEVATAMAGQYTGLPGLVMVLVTGSAARGLADEASDVDVVLYWKEVDAERLTAGGRVQARGTRRVFGLPTQDGFFEKYVERTLRRCRQRQCECP